ncbi:Holliday junction resolvase [Alkalihalobacillus alcalophilus ATCC 27647 = CGMCC 1.3604]|uniref:Putative pre-16S rRNA nuclease n=1 Tax=Alkalihalobacillus alcalophilus ATCC 27647 = CGMCC 1.3604 TaxID=1218173 RepID=A0A094YWW3_ALKAL|nr:Holliday junction resolvase RuvX [Alkalihalobacillus alcalophilus]KGA98017.1 Holliday junction resolvase [Alkalihalobacillus alcalophilus ATCC 27647 = CGMCC 1.3604]MED1561860.1 Holliday junction resolvase RuvX [Alkalihalobacillus alcalophilus]THG90366.1 Holliday junction resolvase [Alkalihalobacillus alcalophilus ATCC 27647 = CGMCC 1.3604]
MRTLGLDVGTKTIGVALSDELGWTAQGLVTLKRSEDDLQSDIKSVSELVQEHEVTAIVVGLPKNMNGTIGPSGEMCQAFAKQLENEIEGIQVKLWDERLTTVAAERMLITADVSRKKRKQVIDKMAAVLILQGYLDHK